MAVGLTSPTVASLLVCCEAKTLGTRQRHVGPSYPLFGRPTRSTREARKRANEGARDGPFSSRLVSPLYSRALTLIRLQLGCVEAHRYVRRRQKGMRRGGKLRPEQSPVSDRALIGMSQGQTLCRRPHSWSQLCQGLLNRRVTRPPFAASFLGTLFLRQVFHRARRTTPWSTPEDQGLLNGPNWLPSSRLNPFQQAESCSPITASPAACTTTLRVGFLQFSISPNADAGAGMTNERRVGFPHGPRATAYYTAAYDVEAMGFPSSQRLSFGTSS